jgi:D-beta-D-heptose 7-phosphate kinase/D-beta-D-heptose 1-phosphate adenosyltransferase
MHYSQTPIDILSFKNTHIFIAGDVILDSYIEGKVSRISPEAPVPVLLENNRRAVPGGAGNVAANIAGMGAQAYICARVGHDGDAAQLRHELERYKVHTSPLVTSLHIPTIVKTRVVSGNLLTSGAQQLVRIDKEILSPLTPEEEEEVLKNYKNFIAINGQKALVLSDYGKGFLTKEIIQKLVELSIAAKIPVITDPKSHDISRYAGSTVIKPNLNEGRAVYKSLHPDPQVPEKNFEKEVYRVAKCYLQNSGGENLVMSLSEHGVLVYGKDTPSPVHFESRALEIADVSGAGDTLVAFLAMGLAAELPLARATELGNIAAGIVCGKLGTATLSPSEFIYEAQYQHKAMLPEKIISLQNLVKIVQNFKELHKKVVFTNGCFDILHAGHVDYLQKARALGDVLIVGLNSDASVSRLKGPSRPIQSADDRATILSALSCIDFIVEFEEDTPLDVIQTLLPTILVKGADYNIENTVGAKEVLAAGGHVEHIALVPGRSTSSIIEKSRK